MREELQKVLSLIFPENMEPARNLTISRLLFLGVPIFIGFYWISVTVFGNTYRGFDWVHFWGIGRVPPFYPPWTRFVIHWLNWHALVSLTLTAVLLAVMERSEHLISGGMTLLALPVLWTIFLGQLDGLALLGVIFLPWLVPLALLKPQVTFFAFAAKKSYALWLVLFLVFSVLVWGAWPLRTLATNSYYAEGRYPQDISIGLWGAMVALPLMWASRGDVDMLMLAGVFMTPHLIPYNLLPATPAIARLRPLGAIIAMALSWLPLSANWLGPRGWWLGWLFVIWTWGNLAWKRYALGTRWCFGIGQDLSG
ncbi:hypothetical protein D6779_01865 [Candidatus Parcubacteria bacterium]|nr:MAG: hypothetical protein D6779_01865 [Candidatus Parcubacteria bacterium]